MGSQRWEDGPLTVNVSYVAPQMPTKLPTNQLPKVSIDEARRSLPHVFIRQVPANRVSFLKWHA